MIWNESWEISLPMLNLLFPSIKKGKFSIIYIVSLHVKTQINFDIMEKINISFFARSVNLIIE